MGTLAIFSTEPDLPEAIEQFAHFEDLDLGIKKIESIEDLAPIEDLEGLIIQAGSDAWQGLNLVRRLRAEESHGFLPALIILPTLSNYFRAVCFDLEFVLPCSMPPQSGEILPGMKKIVLLSRKKRQQLENRSEIEARLRKKQFEGFEELLAEMAKHEKGGYRVQLLRAKAAFERREYKEALDAVMGAIKENKQALEPRSLLAHIYMEMGAIDKAQEVIHKSLAMAPEHPPFIVAQGRLDLIASKFEEAGQSFSKAQSFDADNGFASAGAFAAELLLDHKKEAIKLFKELGPGIARTLHTIALDLARANHLSEAELLLTRSLKLLPSQKDIYKVWMNLGLQAKRHHQLKKALVFFRASATSAPADYEKALPHIREIEAVLKKQGAA